MFIKVIKTRIFKLNESLEGFVLDYLPKVKNESVIVITSKIVALSQGRKVVSRNELEKAQWIKKESEQYIKTRWCYLTLKDGHWCANAGVDESNVAGGGLILWPKNSNQVARVLRKRLRRHYKIKELGILITDSRIFPLRAGVSGVALGYAGFAGLRNYIGKKDLFGRRLKVTKTNVADGLAAAAVMVMGEGRESTPLALIEDSKIQFKANTDPRELRILPKDDLYRPLFDQLNTRRKHQ